MRDEPKRTLAMLIAREGVSLSNDPNRLRALLLDHCGAYRAEINVLIGAAQEGVPRDLLDRNTSVPTELRMGRLVSRLEDNLALSSEAANWGVAAWASGLGLTAENQADAVQARGSRANGTPAPAAPQPGAPGPVSPGQVFGPPPAQARAQPEKSFPWVPVVVITGFLILTVIVLVGQEVQRQQAAAQATQTARSEATATAQALQVKVATGAQWPTRTVSLNDLSNHFDGAFSTYSSSVDGGTLKYQMQAKQGVSLTPSAGDVGQTFQLVVDAMKVSGPASAKYGVVFFRSLDPSQPSDSRESLYEWAADDQQYSRLSVYKQSKWTTLWDSNYVSAVKPGDVNEFVVHAESATGGTHFTLILNGQYVTDLIDNQLTHGGAGVAMELFNSGEQGNWEFSKFELRAPTSAPSPVPSRTRP